MLALSAYEIRELWGRVSELEIQEIIEIEVLRCSVGLERPILQWGPMGKNNLCLFLSFLGYFYGKLI